MHSNVVFHIAQFVCDLITVTALELLFDATRRGVPKEHSLVVLCHFTLELFLVEFLLRRLI